MAQAGSASANVTDEQFAVRDMVRSWAATSKSIDAVRAVEQEDPYAWRAPYRGLAQLGTFGVAIPGELGGAGGSVEDLCLMVDEAAAALVPGPVATTAMRDRLRFRATSGGQTEQQALDALATQSPLNRIATEAEIGKAALFLASDLAGGITGHLLPVDAGLHVG